MENDVYKLLLRSFEAARSGHTWTFADHRLLESFLAKLIFRTVVDQTILDVYLSDGVNFSCEKVVRCSDVVGEWDEVTKKVAFKVILEGVPFNCSELCQDVKRSLEQRFPSFNFEVSVRC